MKLKKKGILLLAIFLLAAVSTATTIPFDVFTSNGIHPVSIFCMVTVTNAGGGFVDLKIENESTVACAIKNVYFDNPETPLFTSFEDWDGDGVDFDVLEKQNFGFPGDAPHGFDPDLALGANPPPPVNGINSPEHDAYDDDFLTITVAGDFSTIESALLDGTLKMGIHIIALPDESSEWATTPEPSTMAILTFGFGLIRLRKKS